MPCRRYYIALAPVDHINGKMAPVRVKCPNSDDPEHLEVSGFWYGYRHANRPDISRYGIRTMCRDLTTKPYTPAEDENRILFTSSLAAVHAHKRVAADWSLMLADFARQSRYVSPIGYAVAACRSNGGQWLTEWISG